MKKLRKNKFLVLAITIIIVSIAYFGVQKAIDNYEFKTNSDISTKEDEIENNDGTNDNREETKYSDDEMNLILEEEINEEGVANGEDEVDGEKNEEGEKNINKDINLDKEKNKIYVYVTGEVNVPGVVILEEKSRIVDAINAAGGTTNKANISKVNLVYILEDGMKVNIPNDNDLKNNPDFEYITMSFGDGRSDNLLNSYGANASSSNSYTSNTSNSKNVQDLESKYSIVNINTATQTELETLPGIGPSIALKIINYRKENGKFSTIEEIKNVSGIGESKFEEIKQYITV